MQDLKKWVLRNPLIPAKPHMIFKVKISPKGAGFFLHFGLFFCTVSSGFGFYSVFWFWFLFWPSLINFCYFANGSGDLSALLSWPPMVQKRLIFVQPKLVLIERHLFIIWEFFLYL